MYFWRQRARLISKQVWRLALADTDRIIGGVTTVVTGGAAVVTGGTPICPPCYHLAPVTRYFLPKFPVLCIPEVPFLAELERQVKWMQCALKVFYSNELCFNRNSNILVKARCSHIRKIFIKILHSKHIYAKTIFPNTPQDSFYSQYMYQMCHHDIRCCRCIWPFVGNRGDIFTLCLVFQCSLQVSNYNEVAFWLFFLNPQNTNKVFI